MLFPLLLVHFMNIVIYLDIIFLSVVLEITTYIEIEYLRVMAMVEVHSNQGNPIILSPIHTTKG